MTTDEVKSYLRQAYKLDKRLQCEQMKLEKLRAAVEYRSPAFDGIGCSGDGNTIGRAVESILERAKHVNELTVTYAQKYADIERTIRSVDDDTLEEVLELRYLQYMKWEEIAQCMNYTERRVLQLHGKALKKISLYFSI